MSEKPKLVKQFSLSKQTAGDKVEVLPVESTDESFIPHSHHKFIRNVKHTTGEQIDNVTTTKTADTLDIQQTDQIYENSEENNYELVDNIAYTRIDDDLPGEITSPNQGFQKSKVIFEDKMVQVPEEDEEMVVDENKQLPKIIALPINMNESVTYSVYPGGGEFNKPSSTISPNLNHSEDEVDCCETYKTACYITFTCGIPLLMKQRRATANNTTMTINTGEIVPPDVVVVPPNKIEGKEDDECLKSCLNVFLLTVTCGVYGLIKDLRRQPPVEETPIYDELQIPAEEPDTPLIVNPPEEEPSLDSNKFMNILCLIATCGLSRLFTNSNLPEQPTPAIEDPDPNITYIDEVEKNEQPLLTEIVDEANMPIVSFTETQKEVLREIAPTVYTSLAQYDLNDTSNKSARSCCASCMDSCCQTCNCDFSNMFSRSTNRKGPSMIKEELFTPTLQKASDEGMKIIQKIIFPLILDVAREIWVALELVTVLIGLILSIATVSFDQNEAFNILHLVLIIITTVLAIIDAVYSLLECRSCKTCYKLMKGNAGNSKNNNSKSTANPCMRCIQQFNKRLDIPRIIISELLLYPLLVCDIFEVIVGRGYEGNSHSDRLGFTLFLLSCISIFLYVYVVRILVLGRSIKRLHKIRSVEFRSNRPPDEVEYFAANEALTYQLCFFVHIVLQMLAHIMMLIAIGGKIRYDNRHFYEPGNTDETIHYSGYLIVMLIIGYIGPTLGYLSFFLVTRTWAKQFPIGVFNDMIKQLKLLKQGGPDNFLSDSDELNDDDEDKLKQGLEITPAKKYSKGLKIAKVTQFISQFSHDYENLRSMTFGKKLEYPFKNPMIVILSILYAAMQLTFIVCAGVAVNEMGIVVSQVLNGGGWVVYYIFAIIIGALANAYVFLVAGFWIFIVCMVIAIIAGIILCIVLFLVIASCGSSRNNTNRNTYYQYR